jgi:AcrR family transcriptional regulator
VTGRARGRPPAEAAPLSDEAIATAGLSLLVEGGEAAVTLRGVARRLGVTPMAVSHRTGGRDGLLAQVVAAAHAGFEVPNSERATAKEIAAAVLAYAETARRHPAAVAALFARPDLMPDSLLRFTEWLRDQIAHRDMALAERGLALLIDYVHGHLLAAAAGPGAAKMEAIFHSNVEQLAHWIMDESGAVEPDSAMGGHSSTK